mgnify:FL=1
MLSLNVGGLSVYDFTAPTGSRGYLFGGGSLLWLIGCFRG